MRGCQFCSFLSDPSTGNIFDPAFPCPKCGRRDALRQAQPRPPAPSLGGVTPMAGFAAPMSVGSNIVAAAKIAGLVACFFYLHNQLGHITDSDDRLGPIKRASYFIPAMSIPYVAELVTKEEWPILGTLFQVGVGGMAIKTALKIDTTEFTKSATEFTKTARASLGLKRKR